MRAKTKIFGAVDTAKSQYVDSFTVRIVGTREKVRHILDVKYIDPDMAQEKIIRYFHGVASKKERIYAISLLRALEDKTARIWTN